MPSGEALVVTESAPERGHYEGQQYWQLKSDKWLWRPAQASFELLSIPAAYDVGDASPDGSALALYWDTHAQLSGAQLFLCASDGSNLRPLARRREQYYWYPRFSPDGQTILAKHLDARTGRLPSRPALSVRLLAIDGTSERSVSISSEHQVEYACWSPDGAQIAIVAFENSAFTGGAKRGAVKEIERLVREPEVLTQMEAASRKLAHGDAAAAAVDMIEELSHNK
jgi:hypothetical protein